MGASNAEIKYQDLFHLIQFAIQEFEVRYNYPISALSISWRKLELTVNPESSPWLGPDVGLSPSSIELIKSYLPPFATFREQQQILDLCFAAKLLQEISEGDNALGLSFALKDLLTKLSGDNFDIALRENSDVFESLTRRVLYQHFVENPEDEDLNGILNSYIASLLTDAKPFEEIQRKYLGTVFRRSRPNECRKTYVSKNQSKRGPFYRIEYAGKDGLESRSYKYLLEEIKKIKANMIGLIKVNCEIGLSPIQKTSLNFSFLSSVSKEENDNVLNLYEYWKYLKLRPIVGFE